MDYIREFDIRLDRETYYAGERLSGCVILVTQENFKLKGESSLTVRQYVDAGVSPLHCLCCCCLFRCDRS